MCEVKSLVVFTVVGVFSAAFFLSQASKGARKEHTSARACLEELEKYGGVEL